MPPRSLQPRFVRRVALFCAPFIAVFVLIEPWFWRTGESWPVRRVIEHQRKHSDALFLRGIFDQQICRYKYLRLEGRAPRVLALGSSRVMKFRAEMFGEVPGDFYNGTGLIDELADFDDYLKLFHGRFPQVIILGVDPWILNEGYRSSRRLGTSLEPDAALDWKAHLEALRHLKPRLWRQLGSIAPASRANRIGTGAILGNQGYRGDGSFATHVTVTATNWAYVDREKPSIPERIRRGLGRFQPAQSVSASALQKLGRVLRELKGQGVTVIGFLPPFSSESVQIYSTDPAQHAFWSGYRSGVAGLFAEVEMPFVDTTDLATLGLDDRYLYDGMHAEETFHLHLLRRLLTDTRVQAALPRAGAAVETALAQPGSNFFYPEFGR
jgi:hypothetical protein